MSDYDEQKAKRGGVITIARVGS